ncbi:FAD-dependent oxidoreductase, partial [Burkholderia pseudomallei]
NGLYRHRFMIAPEIADAAARFAQALVERPVTEADTVAAWRRDARWPALQQPRAAHASA